MPGSTAVPSGWWECAEREPTPSLPRLISSDFKEPGVDSVPKRGFGPLRQSGVPSQRTKDERTVGLPRSLSADTRSRANSPKLRWLTNSSIQRASGAVTLLGEEPPRALPTTGFYPHH